MQAKQVVVNIAQQLLALGMAGHADRFNGFDAEGFNNCLHRGSP